MLCATVQRAADAAAATADGDREQQAAGGSQWGSHCQQRPRAVMPGECGYLLHSMVLEFTHPISRERVVATCPPPPPLRRPGE